MKKVNDGENYYFLPHIGKDLNSLRKKTIKQPRDLINRAQHIPHAIEKQISE